MRQEWLSELKSKIVAIHQLTAIDTAAMYKLYERYYEHVNFEVFKSDLNKKTAAIIIREKSTNNIKGFSTILNMKLNHSGRNVNVIFSGDTIVAREYWGQTALHKAFLKYVLAFKIKNPFSDLYWFLISKGYKTYLLMANNFTNYYPRYEIETPKDAQRLIETCAMRLFPDYYQSDSGLISFPYDSARLKANVAPIDPFLLAKNPRIAFFARKNPDWTNGTELACIGKIDWKLPFSFMAKLLTKKSKRMRGVQDLEFIEPAQNAPQNVSGHLRPEVKANPVPYQRDAAL